jgi:hypothetical protein
MYLPPGFTDQIQDAEHSLDRMKHVQVCLHLHVQRMLGVRSNELQYKSSQYCFAFNGKNRDIAAAYIDVHSVRVGRRRLGHFAFGLRLQLGVRRNLRILFCCRNGTVGRSITRRGNVIYDRRDFFERIGWIISNI